MEIGKNRTQETTWMEKLEIVFLRVNAKNL